MKRNVVIKMLLDIAMTVLYLMLMFARGAGEFFHEAVGIGIGVLFIIHILLNLSMTKGLFGSVAKGKAKASRILLFILDIVLMVCMPIVILSGVLIARELFVINSGLPWELIYNIHNILSYVCLAVMALHLLFHAKYLVGVCKKIPSAMEGKELRSALYRFGAGAAAAFTLYMAVYTALNGNIFSKSQTTAYSKKQTVAETASLPTVYEAKLPKNETLPEAETQPEKQSPYFDSNSENLNPTDSINAQEEANQAITESEVEAVPTLEDYLGNMYCTGCHKHCSLLSPRCGRGQAQAQQAEYEYSSKYSLN